MGPPSHLLRRGTGTGRVRRPRCDAQRQVALVLRRWVAGLAPSTGGRRSGREGIVLRDVTFW